MQGQTFLAFVRLVCQAKVLHPGLASRHSLHTSGYRHKDFTHLGIGSEISALLAKKGITGPSAIQSLAIPNIMAGKNCAIQSHTGTGKTLAYLLPALTLAMAERERLGFKYRSVLALVAAPSRELCMQILRSARELLPQSDQQAAQQLIGGANPKRQHEALRRYKPILAVGTPGRLLDMICSGALQVSHCPLLILDEVDMLSAAELRKETSRVATAVGSKLETRRQTVLVSASLSPQLVKSMEGWCPGAEYVSTQPSAVHPPLPEAAPGQMESVAPVPGSEGPTAMSSHEEAGASSLQQHGADDMLNSRQSRARLILPPGLQHFYITSDPSKWLDHLASCIRAIGAKRAIIFAGSRSDAMLVMSELEAKRLQVTVLHSRLSKLERTNIMNAFARGVFMAIVVTDLASRGLDLPELDAVFSLGTPEDELIYAHRAGRTHRLGGAAGRVVSIISSRDRPTIQRTARRLGIQIQPATVCFGQFVTGGEEPVLASSL